MVGCIVFADQIGCFFEEVVYRYDDVCKCFSCALHMTRSLVPDLSVC